MFTLEFAGASTVFLENLAIGEPFAFRYPDSADDEWVLATVIRKNFDEHTVLIRTIGGEEVIIPAARMVFRLRLAAANPEETDTRGGGRPELAPVFDSLFVRTGQIYAGIERLHIAIKAVLRTLNTANEHANVVEIGRVVDVSMYALRAIDRELEEELAKLDKIPTEGHEMMRLAFPGASSL